MLHVREFTTADDLMAHYRALKSRQGKPAPRPIIINLMPLGREIYAKPIGPNMPFVVKRSRDRVERREALEKVLISTKTRARQIVLDICEEHHVTWNEFISIRRNRYIMMARRKAYWTLKTETSWSLPQIGNFVHKDHTTVLHGIRRYELDMIHAEAGLSIASTREFYQYEQCGCRRDVYLAARERAL